jgi:hypothetical protein
MINISGREPGQMSIDKKQKITNCLKDQPSVTHKAVVTLYFKFFTKEKNVLFPHVNSGCIMLHILSLMRLCKIEMYPPSLFLL